MDGRYPPGYLKQSAAQVRGKNMSEKLNGKAWGKGCLIAIADLKRCRAFSHEVSDSRKQTIRDHNLVEGWRLVAQAGG